jgi:pimeloyl-ACP methyl ester carboxylesterase
MFKEFKEKHGSKFGLRPSGDAPPKESDRGQDLTTILNLSQRADLTILLAQITDTMREAIKSNFKTPKSKENRGGEMKQKDVDYVVKDQKLATKTLLSFDEWRDALLQRVGEALNMDEGKHDQHQSQGLGSEDLPLELDEQSIETLHEVYPPEETPLVQLSQAKRFLVVHSVLLLLLGLEHYNALSRVLMLYLVSSLGFDLRVLNDDEVQVARGLLATATQLTSSNAEPTEQDKKKKRNARAWKVGVASVTGAVLIGVTGGLAAPLIAAGLGTVMGGLGLASTAAAGYLGALAGSGVVVGGLFGAYGGSMTGRMVDKYARAVEDFGFIPTRGSRHRFQFDRDAAREDHRLRVTIGVTGYVTDREDYVDPWRALGDDSEVFGLRWEYKPLSRLGGAMNEMVTDATWTVAQSEILSETIFASIVNAVVLPMGLVKVSQIAENPFSVAKSRADKTGEVLADALISRVQGQRSVNLIGYSLGGRVIYSCLQSLAKREAYGLVENAIFMGTPTTASTDKWRRMRSVVSGRVVNAFSRNDAVLALLYRASSFQVGVAGLQRVEGLAGVENVDVSEVVEGHLRYQYMVGRILGIIGLATIDEQEMASEEQTLGTVDRRQEEERIQNESTAPPEAMSMEKDAGAPPSRKGSSVQRAAQRFEEMGLKKSSNGGRSA